MRLFLQDGPARLQILPRSQVREFRDLGSAREFLRPLLADPGNRAAARQALALAGGDGAAGGRELGVGAGPAWSDPELLDRLARRLVADGLQVISCAESYLAFLRGTFQEAAAAAPAAGAAAGAGAAAQDKTTPLQDEEAARQQQAPAPAASASHFVAIELLDHAGKPVAGERYFVELPDGSTVSGRTDAQGRARVEGVDPGTAKVSFPDLDQKLYQPS
jgi:hypothetical protein